MENVDKFSVLISVYKKESALNLKKALDSIINQTLKPTEIVLVEDGPLTDELSTLINTYQLNYGFINVVKLEKNVGLGRALNIGLNHCKYQYVARMDSDDFSHIDRFEKQIKFMINNPSIDVIGCNVDEYDEYLNLILSKKIVPEKDSEIKKYMKYRNPFNHMSIVYKKDKVLEVGNYLDCPFFEDYYLWCRMAKNGCNFYNLQESLIDVRTGLYMIKKRGGIQYSKDIVNFEIKILQLGTINFFEFLKNVISRIVISNLPKKIRMKFYKKFLRNCKKDIDKNE